MIASQQGTVRKALDMMADKLGPDVGRALAMLNGVYEAISVTGPCMGNLPSRPDLSDPEDSDLVTSS